MAVTEPEIEDISQQHQVTDAPAMAGQKCEQPAVIAGGGIEKVGVCEEDVFHVAK
jgi:hypothetical protein